MAEPFPKTRRWSGIPITALIDRELGVNPELRWGLGGDASILEGCLTPDHPARFFGAIVDYASSEYRAGSPEATDLVTFNDGGADFLFDVALERTVLVWGTSRPAGAARDKAYHGGYPSVVDLKFASYIGWTGSEFQIQ